MNRQTNKIRRIITFGLAVACAVTSLSAEEEEALEKESTPEVELVPYVAVATRTSLPLNQVSPSVSYISEEEMVRNQDRSLVDVLERQPGVIVNKSGANGALSSLFMRGTNSDHTGFFLDGRRLNPGFFNQSNLEFLSIDNLSSVEVQRGPSSVNFGSAGIGGVVSLQTRSSLGEKTASTTAEVEYGSYDTYRGAATTSFADESWAVNVSASAFATDNKRDNDDFELLNLNGRFEYKLTEHLVVELLGFVNQSDKELPGLINNPSNSDQSETESLLISPGLRYQNGDWSGQVFYSKSKLTLDNESLETGFSPPFPTELVDTRSFVKSDELYGQVDYKASINALFSVGALYRNDETSNSNLDFFDPSAPARPFSERFEQIGVWSQIQWQLTDALEVRLGGRYDSYTDFKSSANGDVEALYTFFDFGATVFAKLANSYAPPSASDLGFDRNLQNSVIVNTRLDPEESESYEIGARYVALEDTLRCSIVFFRNEIENLIQTDFAFGGPPDFDPITNDSFNVGHATTEGIEFTIGYEPVEKLNLSCGYTYLVALNDDTDERLLRRPRHALQLSAEYQFTDAWFAGIQGIGYFDRKDIDASFNTVDHEDYFVVDILTDYKLTDQLTLFARIENLLDEEYESVLGFPALGRTGYVGARLAF